jgi:type IV protein arginine methyltransferase
MNMQSLVNMETDELEPLAANKVQKMLQACASGDTDTVASLVAEHPLYARQQDDATGKSPLMVASEVGHIHLVQYLLDQGAPWNAVDRCGQCAGNYATVAEHWDVVNLLVDHGTRAELILSSIQRANYSNSPCDSSAAFASAASTTGAARPVAHEPSTKPNYLRQRLTFIDSAILDEERDAVMMEWERPLMEVHAQIMTDNALHKRVMNVGFGMGIIDTILQSYQPSLHIIIEAHPDVYNKMLQEGWDKKPNTRIFFGKWQDVVPQLLREAVQLDGIFFDTYGEHFSDMEDFHKLVPHMLSKPNGVYSFFNGLAPDNLFFHGVACQCVKLQLQQFGLETEFLPCEIQVNSKEWEGIRRKYWHDRDTYYLPRATWKLEFVDRKTIATSETAETDAKRVKRI